MWRTIALSLLVGLLLIGVCQAEQQENFSDISILLGDSRLRILAAQFECYLKIIHDPPHTEEGPYCNRTWDGWLCWADSFPGDVMQMCPNYFHDFDPAEKVIKVCNPDGQWFHHPESNRVWTNYTQCQAYIKDKLKLAIGLYYLAMVGHGLSIVSLIICLVIFSYFKSLSCQRVSLHKNLFLSSIINSIVTIMWLSLSVANGQAITTRNEEGCKFLAVLMLYTQTSTIFWMLCEGIYLHTLIIVAVFVGEQQLFWYYVLGWVFPIVPSITYAVARRLFFNDRCWFGSQTRLLYIIHGPIYAAVIVNVFFLLNIVRVLITKLKETHLAETNTYMKAVRATIILTPLLGAQFILVPWRPEECSNCTIYDFVSHIFIHFQGLAVAIIVCFCNAEAQAALRRKWVQWKSGYGKSCWLETPHTTTTTSITESSCATISLGPVAAASALSVHNFLSRVHPNSGSRQEKSKVYSNGEVDALNKVESPDPLASQCHAKTNTFVMISPNKEHLKM